MTRRMSTSVSTPRPGMMRLPAEPRCVRKLWLPSARRPRQDDAVAVANLSVGGSSHISHPADPAGLLSLLLLLHNPHHQVSIWESLPSLHLPSSFFSRLQGSIVIFFFPFFLTLRPVHTSDFAFNRTSKSSSFLSRQDWTGLAGQEREDRIKIPGVFQTTTTTTTIQDAFLRRQDCHGPPGRCRC